MNRANRMARGALARAQRGVSMLFALMALIILALGAVALTRSVDTGMLIIGNLGFHQDAVVSSSFGAEQAMKWLSDNQGGVKLDANDTANGYYASSTDDLDATGTRTSASNQLPIVDWDNNCMGLPKEAYRTCVIVPFKATDVGDNKVQYIIQRLCDAPTAPNGTNHCIRPPNTSTGIAKDRGQLVQGGRLAGGMASPYYRIIVRVEGARNTVSYTETLVHF